MGLLTSLCPGFTKSPPAGGAARRGRPCDATEVLACGRAHCHTPPRPSLHARPCRPGAGLMPLLSTDGRPSRPVLNGEGRSPPGLIATDPGHAADSRCQPARNACRGGPCAGASRPRRRGQAWRSRPGFFPRGDRGVSLWLLCSGGGREGGSGCLGAARGGRPRWRGRERRRARHRRAPARPPGGGGGGDSGGVGWGRGGWAAGHGVRRGGGPGLGHRRLRPRGGALPGALGPRIRRRCSLGRAGGRTR